MGFFSDPTASLRVRLRQEIDSSEQQGGERRGLLLLVPSRLLGIVGGVFRGDFSGCHRQHAQQVQLGAVLVQDLAQTADVPRAVRRIPPGVETLRQQREYIG